jgi:nitrogen-specific signal transduction histidine kinase
MREYTDIIIGEADRLQNLLNTILLPSRKAHKKYTNIHQLIIRVSQVIKSEHQQQNLEIDYDFCVVFENGFFFIEIDFENVRNHVEIVKIAD